MTAHHKPKVPPMSFFAGNYTRQEACSELCACDYTRHEGNSASKNQRPVLSKQKKCKRVYLTICSNLSTVEMCKTRARTLSW